MQVKRKLNLETDHQYIAESLPVSRGKARNPAKGISSTPAGPPASPAQSRAPAAPLCSPRLIPGRFFQPFGMGCPLSTLTAVPCAGGTVVLPFCWVSHWLCPSLWDGAVGPAWCQCSVPGGPAALSPLSPAWHSLSQSHLEHRCHSLCQVLPPPSCRGFGQLTPLP